MSDSGEARLETAIRLYRCLCIHVGGFNDVFGALNRMLHGAAITFVIFCVYGSLRTEGALSVAIAYWGTFTLVCYQLTVTKYAESNGASNAFLVRVRTAWSVCSGRQRSRHRKRIGREIGSMREVRIQAGSTFYYDMTLVLTVFEVVLVQSVNLLIMY